MSSRQAVLHQIATLIVQIQYLDSELNSAHEGRCVEDMLHRRKMMYMDMMDLCTQLEEMKYQQKTFPLFSQRVTHAHIS